MLVYFKASNFKSIKDPVVINFSASAISEHNESNTIQKGRETLLKTLLLYGPNASGKSKILDAFVFFRWSILSSATDKLSAEQIATQSFILNSDTKNKPSFFEAEFYIGKTKYRYGFEADAQAIRKEWLLEIKSTTTQTLFLRIGQEFKVESRFVDASGLERRTRPNALFLSVAAQWNAPQAEKITAWFASIYTVHGMGDGNFRRLTAELLQDRRYGDLINQLVREADFGIDELTTMELTKEVRAEILSKLPEEMREQIALKMDIDAHAILTVHSQYNDKGEITDAVTMALDQDESEGTRKFFNLAGPFVEAVLNGKMIVIDELDARLHPLLIKAIIRLFNSKSIISGAQLLGVCHDTSVLDRELLRRDQVCFVEKDSLGATHLAKLVEFKARKEEPFFKNYLEGKYGGIPFITNFENNFIHGETKESTGV